MSSKTDSFVSDSKSSSPIVSNFNSPEPKKASIKNFVQ